MQQSSSNRKFGLLVGGALLIIDVYQVLRHKPLVGLFAAGLLLMLAGLVYPIVLSPFRRLWEKLGDLLGRFNSWLILLAVYVVVVCPVGVLRRLAKKDPLGLRTPKHGRSSYWEQPSVNNETSIEKQF